MLAPQTPELARVIRNAISDSLDQSTQDSQPMPKDTDQNPAAETFREWAIVEIMGRKTFAGLVTETTFGGTAFVRVDVPEVTTAEGTTLPPFSKLFGAGSIYCISPTTEETARAFAAQMRSESFSKYEAPRLAARMLTPSEPHDTDEDLETDDLDEYDEHAPHELPQDPRVNDDCF